MAFAACATPRGGSECASRHRSPVLSPSPSPPPPPYSLCNVFSPKVAPRRLISVGTHNFSIGDFLGAVSLLRDLIDAIQDGGETSREQMELIAELRRLESAILQVEAHHVDVASRAQRIALAQAAHACQHSVNDFLLNVRERQGELSSNTSRTTGEDVSPSLRWNLATGEDLAAFRSRVSAHVQSIQTLLITIQV